jgi:quinol monooxygenase YgiN
MVKLGLFVRLVAKAGKASDVEAFLEQGLELANQEAKTPVWFAIKLDANTFAVFDAFEAEDGRQAHLDGRIAAALMANASTLLAEPPKIEKFDVVGVKLPG